MEMMNATISGAEPTADGAIARKDIQTVAYAREIEARDGKIRALRSELEKAKAKLAAANVSLREFREREDARRLVKRLHRLVKAVLPYGLVCTWKRMAYGIVEDRPLLYYPGFMKRTRRIAKFSLPYFAVALFKRARYGKPGRIQCVDSPRI